MAQQTAPATSWQTLGSLSGIASPQSPSALTQAQAVKPTFQGAGTAPRIAAPAGPTGPNPWDAGQAYANDTYMRSLAGSSSDIDRQVKNALTEISRQRAVAGVQASKIPGAAGAVFDDGAAAYDQTRTTFGTQGLASLAAAFGGGKASYNRMAGLIDQGFKERDTRQQGGVRGIQTELRGDLRTKGNEFASKRQQEDRQIAQQEKIAAQQRALQMEMMARQEAMQRQAMAQAAALAQQEEQDLADEAWRQAIADAMNAQANGELGNVGLRSKANYLTMKDKQNL